LNSTKPEKGGWKWALARFALEVWGEAELPKPWIRIEESGHSLRLRTPFMRMTMKVLKTPNGFLEGLPGPEAWKHPRKTFSVKLKSMFLNRFQGSRVHLVQPKDSPPMLGRITKYETPTTKINIDLI
jgi:hypothetical protein